jgi:hypothetical protein
MQRMLRTARGSSGLLEDVSEESDDCWIQPHCRKHHTTFPRPTKRDVKGA